MLQQLAERKDPDDAVDVESGDAEAVVRQVGNNFRASARRSRRMSRCRSTGRDRMK